MNTGKTTDAPAAQPEELDGEALAGVQGGATANATTVKANAGGPPAAAQGTRSTHVGGVNPVLADGSVR
jgi:hypothetical protein